MDLILELQKIAINNGVSYFGVADLSTVQELIRDQGGCEVTDYPYAISLGIPLMDSIVDRLPNKQEYSVALNYKHHAYNIINQRLDLTASLLSSIIQNKGYKVLPLPAAERIDSEKICGSFSHKLAAKLAGLGWIGKSCLLITPDHGPRVRWTTILTEAPLKPTVSSLEVECRDCKECVQICPVQAFTGRNFREGEAREVRYDARKCERYFVDMKRRGELGVCGLCLYVCPYGKKR